jgi:hypothetical protein
MRKSSRTNAGVPRNPHASGNAKPPSTRTAKTALNPYGRGGPAGRKLNDKRKSSRTTKAAKPKTDYVLREAALAKEADTRTGYEKQLVHPALDFLRESEFNKMMNCIRRHKYDGHTTLLYNNYLEEYAIKCAVEGYMSVLDDDVNVAQLNVRQSDNDNVRRYVRERLRGVKEIIDEAATTVIEQCEGQNPNVREYDFDGSTWLASKAWLYDLLLKAYSDVVGLIGARIHPEEIGTECTRDIITHLKLLKYEVNDDEQTKRKWGACDKMITFDFPSQLPTDAEVEVRRLLALMKGDPMNRRYAALLAKAQGGDTSAPAPAPAPAPPFAGLTMSTIAPVVLTHGVIAHPPTHPPTHPPAPPTHPPTHPPAPAPAPAPTPTTTRCPPSSAKRGRPANSTSVDPTRMQKFLEIVQDRIAAGAVKQEGPSDPEAWANASHEDIMAYCAQAGSGHGNAKNTQTAKRNLLRRFCTDIRDKPHFSNFKVGGRLIKHHPYCVLINSEQITEAGAFKMTGVPCKVGDDRSKWQPYGVTCQELCNIVVFWVVNLRMAKAREGGSNLLHASTMKQYVTVLLTAINEVELRLEDAHLLPVDYTLIHRDMNHRPCASIGTSLTAHIRAAAEQDPRVLTDEALQRRFDDHALAKLQENPVWMAKWDLRNLPSMLLENAVHRLAIHIAESIGMRIEELTFLDSRNVYVVHGGETVVLRDQTTFTNNLDDAVILLTFVGGFKQSLRDTDVRSAHLKSRKPVQIRSHYNDERVNVFPIVELFQALIAMRSRVRASCSTPETNRFFLQFMPGMGKMRTGYIFNFGVNNEYYGIARGFANGIFKNQPSGKKAMAKIPKAYYENIKMTFQTSRARGAMNGVKVVGPVGASLLQGRSSQGGGSSHGGAASLDSYCLDPGGGDHQMVAAYGNRQIVRTSHGLASSTSYLGAGSRIGIGGAQQPRIETGGGAQQPRTETSDGIWRVPWQPPPPALPAPPAQAAPPPPSWIPTEREIDRAHRPPVPVSSNKIAALAHLILRVESGQNRCPPQGFDLQLQKQRLAQMRYSGTDLLEEVNGPHLTNELVDRRLKEQQEDNRMCEYNVARQRAQYKAAEVSKAQQIERKVLEKERRNLQQQREKLKNAESAQVELEARNQRVIAAAREGALCTIAFATNAGLHEGADMLIQKLEEEDRQQSLVSDRQPLYEEELELTGGGDSGNPRQRSRPRLGTVMADGHSKQKLDFGAEMAASHGDLVGGGDLFGPHSQMFDDDLAALDPDLPAAVAAREVQHDFPNLPPLDSSSMSPISKDILFSYYGGYDSAADAMG